MCDLGVDLGVEFGGEVSQVWDLFSYVILMAQWKIIQEAGREDPTTAA